MFKVAIVGGGVAGATAALYLSKLGVDITIFEQRSSLISGPPFCHLHAGGNLYPQISDEERLTLLRQSIDLVHYYPFAIDYRPTVVTIPKEDSTDPAYLLQKLSFVQRHYEELVKKDPSNALLGDPKEYFKLYKKSDLHNLEVLDPWMKAVAKYIDLDRLKEPLAIVQEFGLNIFALSGALNQILRKIPNVHLKLNTKVLEIKETYTLTYETDGHIHQESFDFLINAAGFATGWIDRMLGFSRKRYVEFKAAYVARWDESPGGFPEIIFHGKRGTDKGMAQFTPYGGNLFQLHYMSKKATLFEDGLVSGDPYPELHRKFLELIESDWADGEYEERTKAAIERIATFIPSFKSAKPAAKPLFGAQQIPGDNPELRAADVSFEGETYARCEIVKASSVLDMSEAIAKRLYELGAVKEYKKKRDLSHLQAIDTRLAASIAKERGYPLELAKILYPNNSLP